MIKGMRKAIRSVASSLMMVMFLIYVFAIVLFSLLKEEDDVKDYFGTVSLSMWTLWMDGTIMDNLGDRLWDLMGLDQWIALMLFTLFQLLSAILLMNMLIG